MKYKNTSQTHLVLGFRSYDAYHKANPALSVLAGVLGGGMSSRLFHRIRDQMGAGYYVGAEIDSLTDHGFFAIFAGVDNNRVEEVLCAVLEEVCLARDRVIPEEELEKVKNYFTGNLLSELETSHALASFYGGAEVLRKPLKTPQEKADEIRNVSAQQIQKVARDIFQNKGLNLALIGPFRDKKKFSRLLSL